jgi:autotransporter-associated beta strand protein
MKVLAMAVAMALGLAGCGGGSNVRPTAPPPDNPPPPASNNDQPAIDAHLALTDTYAAHDAGFTGAGVTIGFVDTGINRQHPALVGRVVKSLVYLDATQNDLSKDDVVGHGTWVAQIAAGKPFGQWPGGIAPDASLVSARIISDKPPADDGSGNGNQIEASDAQFFADTLHPDLIDADVQIMNNSWGGLYFDPANFDTVAAAFAAAYRPFVIDHDGIVVFATGNESKADPTDTTSLPGWAPELERGWIAAAALDSLHPDQLASYSNACGRAKDFCLAAPGDVIVTGADDTAGNPDYWVVRGTSFAAPEVSGAAALVWQAFPYFDNDMVRQTLLGTATDLGAPGVDAVFGWGALDVGKAVKGPANFAWGDVSVSINFPDTTSVWSNDIVGAGGLTKQGAGTLVLAGHNSYTGDTNIMFGTLESAFALPGNVNVSGAGRLSGIYENGATETGVPGVKGNLDNAAVVVVSGGDLVVGGNYHQAINSYLGVRLGSKLDVAGTATIDGGTLTLSGAEPGYVSNNHQELITAAGVTGTFSHFDTVSEIFLSSTLQYGANDVWIDTTSLNISAAAAAAGVDMKPASIGSAQRVQSAFEQLDQKIAAGNVGSVSSAFLRSAGAFQHTASAAAAQASLESLSGELHAASAALTFEAIDASNRALSDRFDALLDQRETAGMWMHDLDVGGNMARSGFDGIGFQLDGWMAGSDRRIGASGVAGFAFGQSRGNQQLDGRADRNRSRSTEGMLYAGWSRGDVYTQGRVGFGHYRQDVRRQLLLGSDYQGVGTDYNGRYDVAYGESGLHFQSGGMQLTPFVDVQYARIDRDAFAEQGAGGFGLRANAQTLDRWQAGLGMRATHRWEFGDGHSLDFGARVEWQRTLASHGDVFEASFVGIDQWQPLAGVGLSRRSAVFGLDLDAHLSDNAALKFGYDYGRGDRAESNTLSARFTVAF